MTVIARFRNVSDFQPLTDARDLRAMVMNWSLNEHNIPKRKRVLFIEDLKDITTSIVKNTRDAQYAFPRNEEILEKRKDYIQKAVDSCMDLWDEFAFIDDVQITENPINIDKLLTIHFMIYRFF